MNKKDTKKLLAEILFLLALIVVTFFLMLKDQDVSEIIQFVFSVQKRWLLPAVAAMTLYIFCGGLCIRVMLNGMGKPMSVAKCFKYSFVEFYFSAITPSSTGGQPMQLVYMKRDGYSVSDSTVILLAITALYKLAFLVLCCILFLLNGGYALGLFQETSFLFVIGLLLNVGLILGLSLLLFSKRLIHFLAHHAIHLLRRLRLIKRPDQMLRLMDRKLNKYHACAHFIKDHPVIIFRTFLVLLTQRLSIALVPYFVYRSFGFHTYSLLQILCTQLVLGLCVEMLPLPGAVGISETIFLILFGPIFTEEFVYSAVLLSRGISFYLMLLISSLFLIGMHFFHAFFDKRKH